MRVRLSRTRSILSAIIAIGMIAVSFLNGGFRNAGLFGIFWLAMAVLMVGAFLYNAFSRRGIALFTVNPDDDADAEDRHDGLTH